MVDALLDGAPFTEAWETQLLRLSPVEERGGHLWKREDLFAPHGAGCPDGTKMRNLTWLLSRTAAPGVLAGGSVHSPALGRIATVARHYGKRCIIVLGATRLERAVQHLNIGIAALAGAEFRFVRVAYNPAMQKALRELHAEMPDWFRVQYGIGVDDNDPELLQFYRIGGQQVRNVPDAVDEIILPAGSCNAAAAILFGIATYRPELRRVQLVGVGPSRMEWLRARLLLLQAMTREPVHDRFFGAGAACEVIFHDLHAERFARYEDRMPYALGGVQLHPTYEGKAMTYMARNPAAFEAWWRADGRSLFWIVGAESRMRDVARAFSPCAS